MQMQVRIGLLYFVKKNEIIYFDSFGVKEFIKEFPGNKNIKTKLTSTRRQFNNVWILLNRIY